jgi:hypothetical protein
MAKGMTVVLEAEKYQKKGKLGYKGRCMNTWLFLERKKKSSTLVLQRSRHDGQNKLTDGLVVEDEHVVDIGVDGALIYGLAESNGFAIGILGILIPNSH